jgi:hypothetical protein
MKKLVASTGMKTEERSRAAVDPKRHFANAL